jgi:hypothetical protein
MREMDPINLAGVADETHDDDGIPRHRMRLPGFILDEPTGAGRIVTRLTSAVGIRPCEPCNQRAARLDQWLRFEPRR